jgi:outer membrane protein assembly factor BamB
MKFLLPPVFGLLLLVISLQTPAVADDWPRYHGPDHTGISKETGWLSAWPAEGPKKLWETNVGVGYSSCSVSKGRLYTMGNVAEKDIVFCIDAETGAPVWKHEYPCPSKDHDGYEGTRSTPTVDEDRVYTLSRQGDFFCLDAAKGSVLWSKDLRKDFGGVPPLWGYAESVLVEKDWVLVMPGGKGASVVALDKKTGTVVWKAGNDEAAYSSLVPFDLNGERVLAVNVKNAFVILRMKDGTEVMRTPWQVGPGINVATPVVDGDKVFLSGGYNAGCVLLQITKDGLKDIWRNKNMRNHVNTCVLWNGALYGYDENELRCLDYKTGEVKWSEKAYGKGSVMLADGKLILFGMNCLLGLAEPTTAGYKEIARVQLSPGDTTFKSGRMAWAVPVLANGRLYCRCLDKLIALDLKGDKPVP